MNIFISFNPTMFASDGLARLKKAGHAVTFFKKDHGIPRAKLLKSIRGKDAVMTLLTDKVDTEFLEAAGPQLKIVANYAVGFDNVDVKAAQAAGVIITNTPCDEVNDSVAEHAFALLIALAHRIPEADVYAKAEKYSGWTPTLLLGTDLTGKTLGIIGAGRIGATLAERAAAFGMKIVYDNPKRNLDLEKKTGAKKLPLPKLFATADAVSLHVPLLPSTRHLVSTKELALMKPTAFLINTSRGPVVDELALLKALKKKRIAGAALDVYECEPAIDCDISDSLALKKFPNAILTPHIGSATIEARQGMGRVAAQNIIAVLGGKKPLNPAQ
jgi:glyoxylate reductase